MCSVASVVNQIQVELDKRWPVLNDDLTVRMSDEISIYASAKHEYHT